MRDLTGTLQRLDPTGARAVRHALRIAGGTERLRAAHLAVGLLVLDGGLVLRKLRDSRVDRTDLVRQVYLAAAAPQSGNLAGTVRILLLADMLAAPGVPINTQHLFAALLLTDGNPITAYLTNSDIDCRRFVRQRFARLFAVDEALRDLASQDFVAETNVGGAGEALAQYAAARQPLAAATVAPPLVPAAPRVAPPSPPVPAALQVALLAPPRAPRNADPGVPERTAMRWLRKLIPSQAERYAEHRFVEINSTLFPGRRYRICHGGSTHIYERGTPCARSCLVLRDGTLPPTDRVIAEYFMIQGDESRYLKTANISRW